MRRGRWLLGRRLLGPRRSVLIIMGLGSGSLALRVWGWSSVGGGGGRLRRTLTILLAGLSSTESGPLLVSGCTIGTLHAILLSFGRSNRLGRTCGRRVRSALRDSGP